MSKHVQFQYDYTVGDTWATGFIGTATKNFRFVCSYLLNNPLEELLNAAYQIIPNLTSFPRKQIHFMMLDEPIEYRWEFKISDEQTVSIYIYKKGYDKKSALVFEDSYNIYDFVKALVQCIKSNPHLKCTGKIEWIYKEFSFCVKELK